MKDIFESDEFKRLEALCHSRKLSFVLALSKGGGGVHRPKKGPAYVMSDFFMYEIPPEWELATIRPTPASAWVNPRPLPLLSRPLSQLATRPKEIKANFVEIWDHFHGVLTDTYFCPKLYLTKMPRATVEKWMPTTELPKGELLSCADLVMFPAFVQWVRTATVEQGDGSASIRVGFTALILQLACSLYSLDPEQHCKDSAAGQDSHTSPGQEELTSPTARKVVSGITLIPEDVLMELDKIPDLCDSDDGIEILDTPQPKTSAKKGEVVEIDCTSTGPDLENIKKKLLPEMSITVAKKTSLSSEERLSGITISSTSNIKELAAKAKEMDENEIKKRKAVEEEAQAKKAKDDELKVQERIRKNKELVAKAKEAEEIRRKADAATAEEEKETRKRAAEEFTINKAKQDEQRAKQKKEEETRNAVSESLGRLIQVVIKKMSKDDYNKFSRKVSKNLNNLDPKADVVALKKVIDAKREEIQKDEKNVFVHIKGVFDELKKYKKTTPPPSDNEVLKEDLAKTETTTHVFRWMDGNDNPAEGDKPAIEIDNADDDELDLKDVKKKEPSMDKENLPETKMEKASNGEQGSDEITVLLPLKADEKKDERVVSSTSNIKEIADKVRQAEARASAETVEYVVTTTEDLIAKEAGENCGKRKAEEVVSAQPIKKVCLTTVVTKVPDKSNIQESSEPIKKKVCLTTVVTKVSEKPIAQESASLEPEKEKPAPALEGSSEGTSKPAKKVSEKHIEKLEAALKKCSKMIKKYEEKEVDWDDEAEEESNYLMTNRLKKRFMKIYAKIAEAKALSASLDRRSDKRLKCAESRYPEINKKIEKFVNRTKQFPDFQDIMRLVRAANKELRLSEREIHAEAESIFHNVGKTLKRRREVDDHDVMTSYLTEEQGLDPAAGDQQLEQRLQEQAEEGRKNMADYLDNFYRKKVVERTKQGSSGAEDDKEDGVEEMEGNDDKVEDDKEDGVEEMEGNEDKVEDEEEAVENTEMESDGEDNADDDAKEDEDDEDDEEDEEESVESTEVESEGKDNADDHAKEDEDDEDSEEDEEESAESTEVESEGKYNADDDADGPQEDKEESAKNDQSSESSESSEESGKVNQSIPNAVLTTEKHVADTSNIENEVPKEAKNA